jgi:hypothetical protein
MDYYVELNLKDKSVDSRDILSILLVLLEKQELFSRSLILYCRDINLFDNISFMESFGFTFIKNINVDPHLVICEDSINIYYRDAFIFRKFIEHKMYSTNSNPSSTFIMYLSGYIRSDYISNVMCDYLIGPKWSFSPSNQLLLSGVNLLPYVCDFKTPNPQKSYRAICVGSTSLNKNILFSLMILIITRTLLFAKGTNILPDVLYIKKYDNNFISFIIWKFLSFIKNVFNILHIKIIINLTESSFSHNLILDSLNKSKFSLITYLKEGFPRFLGESVLLGTPFILYNRIKFGSSMYKKLIPKYNLFSILSLIVNDQIPAIHTELYNLLFPEKKSLSFLLSDISKCTFNKQLSYLQSEQYKALYYLLTKDSSWFRN